MRTRILSKEQIELLPLIKQFSSNFYLVGGTAFGLYLGHRKSIDFDLFSFQNIKRKTIKNMLSSKGKYPYNLIFEDSEQIHILMNHARIAFFHFPFKIEPLNKFKDIIKIPSLLDLSAMKAFSLGGRAKWKDYVDLFFILKYHYKIEQIINRAEVIFGDSFSSKLFKMQLSYFDDIDFTEEVEFVDKIFSEDEIKEFLSVIAIE